MPNTKSAKRRMRGSVRKQANNRSTKARLHTLEKTFKDLAGAGKKTEAATALKNLASAFDKAAKTGTIHKSTASRRRSRLTLSLNRVGTKAA